MSDASRIHDAGGELSRRAGGPGLPARLPHAAQGEERETAGGEEILPYRRADYLLTQAERVFYDVLCRVVDAQRHRAFCKVRLGDLLWVPKGADKRLSYRNRVRTRHVDFVVCSTDALRPLLVIELDDRSHGPSEQEEPDSFFHRALAAAGLPILHVAARAKFDAAEIAAEIRRAMGG